MPNSAERPKVTPYHDSFQDLVVSIMRAQADLAHAIASTALDMVPDGLINRHFAWLTQVYDEGVNRHLFDASIGASPLRVKSLRNRRGLPKEVRAMLDKRGPLAFDEAQDELSEVFVQPGSTRISRLVKASFVFANPQELEARESWEEAQPSPPNEPSGAPVDVVLKSPLSIAFDYLTAPSMPASRAYALLPVRNFVFETFGVFPSDVGVDEAVQTFSSTDLEEALSHIWTSFRPRYWSRGRDPLPAEGRTEAGGVLRHFLAARNALWMRFSSLNEAGAFLETGVLRPPIAPYEFVRSNHLERLPDLGELVNELWGLPIPIRGAETVLRGGLKFSSRRGLVVGMHGGPGTGKTSLALTIGAVLAPMGIDTLFITAEETREDLEVKANSLVPDEIRRMSFSPKRDERWLDIARFQIQRGEDAATSALDTLETAFADLAKALEEVPEVAKDRRAAPKPCRAVIVLDGVHDLIMAATGTSGSHQLVQRLREFIVRCRELRALVVLTAGEDWAGERAFDYLVDVAFHLTNDHISDNGRKPDRSISLVKARHQLCSVGTHGLQIGGTKGVRFSPQINYQIDRKSIWRTRLPEMQVDKSVFRRVLSQDDFEQFNRHRTRRRAGADPGFHDLTLGLKLFRGSNIFLNGEGSGGKAALAIKIAISPTFGQKGARDERPERILVVSFLYPALYYENIIRSLLTLRRLEYGVPVNELRPAIEVIHLYPGNYRADQLFNRVEWMLDAADLQGDPFTSVVIDGLHNVFLQFPEIEDYTLFWPQLYAALRLRPLTIISTHTTFVLQGAMAGAEVRLDDQRSEPLRHALVQKTDFRFEIDPYQKNKDGFYERTNSSSTSNIFCIRTISAINQPIPQFELMWSRDGLVLFEPRQKPQPGTRNNNQGEFDLSAT